MERYEKLKRWITDYPSVAVAFSGGVDSTLLLRAACDALGQNNVLAVTVSSTLHGCREMQEAKEIADSMQVRHMVKQVDPLLLPEVKSNSTLRCYFCKKMIFQTILQLAQDEGIHTVIDGTNASDVHAYRPGIRALQELHIQSPLKECGISKENAREILRNLGMEECRKPSNSCLATRIPYDTELQMDMLKRIDDSEELLRGAGFEICRVRAHGDLARIEVPIKKIQQLLANTVLLDRVKNKGFTYVCVDYEGYRSGCYDHLEVT